MSNPSIRSTNTSITETCKVEITFDPNSHGYVVLVSKEIYGKSYYVKSVLADYVYETMPSVVTELLEKAMKALNQLEKETMIKEFNNPSFRRKDDDRKNQTI